MFIIIVPALFLLGHLSAGESVNQNEQTAVNNILVEKLIGGAYQGYSILGNGNVCAVYSDDVRTCNPQYGDISSGLQHFYYQNYQHDYISYGYPLLFNNGDLYAATWSKIKGKQELAPHIPLVATDPFFAAYTEYSIPIGITHFYRTYVNKDGAVIISSTLKNTSNEDLSIIFFPLLGLNEKIVTDRTTVLKTSEYNKNSDAIINSWENGTFIIIGLREKSDGYKIGNAFRDMGKGKLSNTRSRASPSGMQLALQKNLMVPSGETVKVEYYLIAKESTQLAINILHKLRESQSVFAEAKDYWENWLNSGHVPKFEDETLKLAYAANLTALKASNLNGAVPADITGQFVTNNMPQLYPRDALMSARAFLLTCHVEEAKDVLNFWTNPTIPKKTPGEFYARYDAYGQAVDAGTGAPYDVPEWDSNGYYATLMLWIYERTGEWVGDYKLMKKLLDFLAVHQEENGLFQEGGIIEWVAHLPSTNMSNYAALLNGAQICKLRGDPERAFQYREVAEQIPKGLCELFDKSRNSYMDLRNGIFMWNTSTNFGVLWGYPNTPELASTNKWYLSNTQKLDGGMQYFDAKGYGHDVFFFNTAAAAQYHARYGSAAEYQKMMNWMLKHSNIYGLTPERAYLDGSGASPASPLSWCMGEFALAILEGYNRGLLPTEVNDINKDQ